LEESISNQFLNYPFLAQHNRYLKNLNDEDEFIILMKRIK